MDIALQNFDVHAFRAAFQLVKCFIISKQMVYLFNTFIYAMDISLYALCLVTLHLSSCSMLFYRKFLIIVYLHDECMCLV